MNDEIKTYDELQKRIQELEYDLSIRKQIDKTLLFLSQHGWENPRESFFHSLARFLAGTLQMDYVCIDRLKGDLLEAETLAIYFDGKFEDNVTYTLKETPCGDVVDKTICCYPDGVRHLFKNDVILQDMLAESYVGTTLYNSRNEPIGLIAVIGRQPLKNSYFAETVLKLAAVRASGELERLNAERELKESEAFLNETGEIAKISGWKIDLKNSKLFWTRQVYKIHEVDEGFLPTFENAISFYDEQSIEIIRQAIIEAVESGKPFDMDLGINTAKGNHRFVRAIGKAIRDKNGVIEFISGTFQDITEKKFAEIKLQDYSNELKKLNSDKDRFMSILAHDLKNPLGSLLGFSDLLAKNLRQYDLNKIERQIKIINETARKTYSLLEDILLWARAQSGKMPYEPQNISLKEICHQIMDDLKDKSDSKQISMMFFEPENTILRADLNMLKTILRNLISNAIKFTNKNGQIKIYTEKSNDLVTVIISDTGVGIQNENIEKLWDLSTPFTTSGTDDEPGTGLGLLICKEFVEKHHGKIWVESEFGMGSDFKFTMPVYKV